jgi:transcriptional regulator with XRE-family HTH domain
MELGGKLKKARLEQKLSLEEVSAKSGLSIGFISQIENDKANPSIGSLKKIADGLGMQFASFFENLDDKENQKAEKEMEPVLVKSFRRKSMKMPGSDVQYYLLSPDLNRKMEFILMIANSGVDSGEEPFSHEGEECGIVIKGKIEFTVGQKTFVMEEGDSLYLESALPHSWRNIGDTRAELIWVITPPSF